MEMTGDTSHAALKIAKPVTYFSVLQVSLLTDSASPTWQRGRVSAALQSLELLCLKKKKENNNNNPKK